VATLLDRSGAWRNQIEEAAMIQVLPAACIAADMGTGKSRAALLGLEHQAIVLIVCPIAVAPAWVKQIGLWDPTRVAVNLVECGSTAKRAEKLKSLKISGRQRTAVIVNYDSAWRGELGKVLDRIPWSAILLDESHRIKSPSGRASRWLARLAALHPNAKRVCMTGTPTPHSPLDWWSQFRFLDPSILGSSYTAYRSRIAVTHPQYPGWVKGFKSDALEALSRRIDPYVYRIRAEDVITLPEAIHTEIEITLPPKAREFYDSLERDMIAILEESGEAVTAANKLSLVLRLQQVTSGHPQGIALYGEGKSPKELALADIVQDLDEPLVVFCKFRQDIDAVSEVLRRSGKTVSELSGRKKSLEAWQNGETDSLVVQQQAGGVGIDLTRACVAIYYSLSHSLGDYLQSLARLRRPGQTRTCRFLHLVASDTVDEAIYAAIERKADIVEEVFSRLQTRKESQPC
jgi:SNF2 family DNA or RNA helicase